MDVKTHKDRALAIRRFQTAMFNNVSIRSRLELLKPGTSLPASQQSNPAEKEKKKENKKKDAKEDKRSMKDKVTQLAEAHALTQYKDLLERHRKEEEKADQQPKENLGFLDSIWSSIKSLGSTLLDMAPALLPLLMAII